MRILAIESSSIPASIAICESGPTDNLLFVENWQGFSDSRQLDIKLHATRSLIPAIQALLHQNRWTPDSLDLIAVTTGPGSFTGLRIGVTTAKMLAYTVGAQVTGINTLQLIAATWRQQHPSPIDAPLVAAIDAQRQELFVQSFNFQGLLPRASGEVAIVQISQLADSIDPANVICLTSQKIAEKLDVSAAQVTILQPAADLLGHLAAAAPTREDPMFVHPNYFRKSAAEEKSA